MAAKRKRSSSQRRTKTGSKSRRKTSNQVRTEMHHMRSGKIPRKGAAKKK